MILQLFLAILGLFLARSIVALAPTSARARPRAELVLPMLRLDQTEIAAHPAKIKVVAMGRRWGKTVLGLVLALCTAYCGGRVAWIVPTYKNGRPLWRAAEAATRSLRKAKLCRTNRSERTIEFASGGFLAIYSADNPDSIRGEAFHLVILDEAAMISEEAWTDVIQPTLADFDGDAILISTPKGRNWFWKEWQRGQTDGVTVKSWTAPSCANPSPQIQKAYRLAKQRVPDKTFRQEWNAEFVEDGTNPFNPIWWLGKNRFNPDDPSHRNRLIGRWLSFDTGFKDTDTAAYSSCTVGELTPEYHLQIREVWRDKLAFPDLVAQIEAMMRVYNYDGKLRGVIIESKASGISAYQTLTGATADPNLAALIIPFEPSGSKEQRASQAGVWCRNDCVQLPHPSESVLWLEAFEDELFTFPDSEYKDQVDSFSQLVIYLERLLMAGYHARLEALGAQAEDLIPALDE